MGYLSPTSPCVLYGQPGQYADQHIHSWALSLDNARIEVKLIIFGSTGSIGRQLVKQALEQGHMVTAFARDPVRVDIKHNNLQVAQGQCDGSRVGGESGARPRSGAVFNRGGQERYGPVRGNTKYHPRDGEGGRPTSYLPNNPRGRR